MIAALAAGLLGQIEGSKAVANGLSSLLGNGPRPAISRPADPTQGGAQGRAPTAGHLSDTVRASLLQLQGAGAVQADDTGDAVDNLG